LALLLFRHVGRYHVTSLLIRELVAYVEYDYVWLVFSQILSKIVLR